MEEKRSWFLMAPKRRSSEAAEDKVIRKGCLIKSPPSNSIIFTSRASWKGRLMKVCRTPLGVYYIRYYAYNGATEEYRGEIPISDIRSIELGTNIKERIQTIVRLFNNSPEHVLCIKTSKRDYYLVDDNEKNIADWKACLTDIWVEINKTDNVEAPRIPKISSPTVETSLDERPKSYPQDYPRTESALAETQERQRSHTDQERRRECLQSSFDKMEKLEPEDVSEYERRPTLPVSSPHWCPLMAEIRRVSLDDSYKEESRRDSGESDAAYISDPERESIYDYPRSIPVGKHPSLDNTEEESIEYDSPDDDVYEKMDPVPQNLNDSEMSEALTPADQSPANLEEAKECTGAPKQTASCPPKPIRTSKLFMEPNRYPIKTQRSQLRKAYILKLMYEEMDTVRLELTVPTAHLRNYLGLQEVGERLYVSKWKGPPEIGCLFHYGDHIEAINGVRTERKDFFFQILKNSVTPEVNLVVIQKKNAGVFHVEGCQCVDS